MRSQIFLYVTIILFASCKMSGKHQEKLSKQSIHRIESLEVITDFENGTVELKPVVINPAEGVSLYVEVYHDDKIVAKRRAAIGERMIIRFPKDYLTHLKSGEECDLKLILYNAGKEVDVLSSKFLFQ